MINTRKIVYGIVIVIGEHCIRLSRYWQIATELLSYNKLEQIRKHYNTFRLMYLLSKFKKQRRLDMILHGTDSQEWQIGILF